MTAIVLETEVIASGYDAAKRICSYTIERGGKRWTVAIPLAEIERNGPLLGAKAGVNRLRRRGYVAAKLSNAMQGPHDAA